jgi:hypothetical protein
MLVAPSLKVCLDGIESWSIEKDEVMDVVRVVFELFKNVFGEELHVEGSREEDQTQKI